MPSNGFMTLIKGRGADLFEDDVLLESDGEYVIKSMFGDAILISNMWHHYDSQANRVYEPVKMQS